jgi:hypothetical protein
MSAAGEMIGPDRRIQRMSLWARLQPCWRLVGRKPDPQLPSVRSCIVALLVCFGTSASAQSIFKSKGADGRIAYSSAPCASEGATLPITTQRRPANVTANTAAGAAAPSTGAASPSSADASVPPPTFRAPLPKQCDNNASLQFVVARLDSAVTPDDIRSFLADERFRLLRCEFTRFSTEERREREAAMRDLEAREAARRHAAILRVESLYDRYLNASERTARERDRQR